MVANQLPLRAIAEPSGGHRFEWDEDSLIGQAKVLACFSAVRLCAARSTWSCTPCMSHHAFMLNTPALENPSSSLIMILWCCFLLQEGIDPSMEVVFVGSLPVDVPPESQEVRYSMLALPQVTTDAPSHPCCVRLAQCIHPALREDCVICSFSGSIVVLNIPGTATLFPQGLSRLNKHPVPVHDCRAVELM